MAKIQMSHDRETNGAGWSLAAALGLLVVVFFVGSLIPA